MRRRPTSIPLLALLLPATQVRGLAGAPRRPPGGGGGGGGGGRRRTAVRPSSGRYGGGGGYSPRNDGYARDGYSRDARDGGWGEDPSGYGTPWGSVREAALRSRRGGYGGVGYYGAGFRASLHTKVEPEAGD